MQILEMLKKEYIDSDKINQLLKSGNISILDDFLNNWKNIETFYKEYYSDGIPKIVLCGINPGKNGAGKTGIPFSDFESISKLIQGIDRRDNERSATFFNEIVEHFGAKEFYKNFYVTNISWIGYEKDGKNVNYYDLPESVQQIIYNIFKKEMDLIKPKYIISLGQSVQKSLNEIFDNKNIDISNYLPHPNWCSFPSKKTYSKDKYINLLSELIKLEETSH